MILSPKSILKIEDFINFFEQSSVFIEDECNCFICRKAKFNRNYSMESLQSLCKDILGFSPFLLDKNHLKFFSSQGTPYLIDINGSINIVLNMFKDILKIKEYSSLCFYCGKPNSKKNIGDGKNVCEHCLNSFYSLCPICEEYHIEKKRIHFTNGKKEYVCLKCIKNKKIVSCNACGVYTKIETAKSEWLKLNKYNHILENDNETVHNYMCKACTTNYNKVNCASCGKPYFHIRNELCDKCTIYEQPVHDWRYKPIFDYFIDTKKEKYGAPNLYFGLELEFENSENKIGRNLASRLIRSKWPEQFLYCVHDGSLESRDRGLELVSMPFTYKYFIAHEDDWINVLKQVRSCGFRGDGQPRAGCHIHMNKDMFHSFHLYKLCKFVFSEDNRDLILSASKRVNITDNDYWSFNPSRYGNEKDIAKFRKNNNVIYDYNNRRTAINVTDYTVEMRIFQSTTKLPILKSYIEFCIALYKFTRDYPPKNNSTRDFCAYLINNESLYTNIIKHLTEDKNMKGYFA